MWRARRRFRSKTDRHRACTVRPSASALKRNEVKTDSQTKIWGRRTHELQVDHLRGNRRARSRSKALDDRVGYADVLYSNGSAKIKGSYRYALKGDPAKRGACQALEQIVARINHGTGARNSDGQNCRQHGSSLELHCNLLWL